MRKLSVILVVLISLLCACSTEQKTVQVDNKDFVNTLFVQKVENNFTSDKLLKQIEDQEKIEQVLSMVEGLEAEEIDNDELIGVLENHANYYMFQFSEGENTNTDRGDYGFQVLEDGIILFSYDQPNTSSQPLITVNTHKDLLEDMKEMLEITF
ncbi:hypothetical protein SAMN04487943_10590 [Gracilibacillus orientalis]|uniref:Uncharacterized protein n=1 Tax=Gracilibacillus orientalis TaxID=334253 RepID=A0A1I4LLR0_9BACI|nr:hypothetical protein [Gracilibacillus orientalis]SFL91915.1 hypothetical protein SAMN04487943_10590 [Gracilibacillus orientalis]